MSINTNGLTFILKFWSTREIDFFRVKNQDCIDLYRDSEEPEVTDEEHLIYGPEQHSYLFRSAYLETAIEISDTFESAVILLNPKVLDAEGEWEAWFFAGWLPGCERYPSFWELMQAQYKRELEQAQN